MGPLSKMCVGSAHSGAGHIADNFWDFEEVSNVSCVQKGNVAASLDASRTYLVEHAGEAFSGVDEANEYSLGLSELADRCDAFGGRDGVVLTE